AAPTDSKLPGGGGFPVTFLTRNSVSAFGAVNNYYTFESDYGSTSRYWHGVDVDVRARLKNGLTLQGGSSTGRGVRDRCDVFAQLPELYTVLGVTSRVDSCHVAETWLTTVRGLATYTVPKIDVIFSAIVRMQPNAAVAPTGTTVATNGLALAANLNVPSSTIQQV